MRNREEIINDIGDTTATTFALAFLEKSEDAIRQVAHQRGRTYKSLTTAVRNGMGRRWWLPAVRLALAESLYAAASADTSTSQNRLREEALKQSIKTYLVAA